MPHIDYKDDFKISVHELVNLVEETRAELAVDYIPYPTRNTLKAEGLGRIMDTKGELAYQLIIGGKPPENVSFSDRIPMREKTGGASEGKVLNFRSQKASCDPSIIK